MHFAKVIARRQDFFLVRPTDSIDVGSVRAFGPHPWNQEADGAPETPGTLGTALNSGGKEAARVPGVQTRAARAPRAPDSPCSRGLRWGAA